MGLDMYLWRAQKSGLEHGKHPTANWDNVEQVAYWRKANAVHGWFVEHVQDGEDECEPFIVSRKDLETLLGLCRDVHGNHEAAEELLPTQEGFFFGSVAYDDYYFEDIELTIRQCEKILKTFDFERNDLVYRSSW